MGPYYAYVRVSRVTRVSRITFIFLYFLFKTSDSNHRAFSKSFMICVYYMCTQYRDTTCSTCTHTHIYIYTFMCCSNFRSHQHSTTSTFHRIFSKMNIFCYCIHTWNRKDIIIGVATLWHQYNTTTGR